MHALLRLGGTPFEEEARHPEARGVPEMERLAKLVGQTTACGDVRLGAHPVAGLEQIDRAHPLHQTVEVGARGRRGEAIELVHDLAAPREAVGVLADLMLLHEALHEQHRIAEPARHRDRVSGERPTAGELPGGVRHSRGELREDGGAERRVPAAESRARLLEQRHRTLIVRVARDGPPEAVAEGRLGQELRIAEPQRQVGGFEERLPGGVRVAGDLPRPGVAEQQLAAAALLGAGHQRERAFVVAGALVEPVALDRPDGGARAVLDRLLDGAAGRGAREVMRQLVEVRTVELAVQALERFPDRAVQRGAARRTERLVQDLAHERVGEAPAPRILVHLRHQTRRERLLECREHLHRGLSRGRGEDRHGHLDAGRGGQIEQVPGRGGEPREALADHLADGGRDAERPGGVRREPLELPLAREQPHDLAHEEGVAAGVAEHCLDHRRRREEPCRRRDEARERVGLEAAQHEPLCVWMAGDGGQRGIQRVVGDDVQVSIGREEDDGGAPETRRQELEQQERRAIGPLEVLEDEEDGLAACSADERTRRAVEE